MISICILPCILIYPIYISSRIYLYMRDICAYCPVFKYIYVYRPVFIHIHISYIYVNATDTSRWMSGAAPACCCRVCSVQRLAGSSGAALTDPQGIPEGRGCRSEPRFVLLRGPFRVKMPTARATARQSVWAPLPRGRRRRLPRSLPHVCSVSELCNGTTGSPGNYFFPLSRP